MSFIPAKKDLAPGNVEELCSANLTEALGPYFSGKKKEENLKLAVQACINSISHMLTMQDVRKSPLGATVMTESASAVKRRGSVPRNM
jgi:hypothetical protein